MLLIGLGNEFRGDDAIGLLAMNSLKKRHPDLGEFINETKDLSRLITIWEGKDLIIVDAIRSSKLNVGDIFTTSTPDEIINMSDVLFSTHGIDLSHILALGKNIDKMPKSIFFIGVNGRNWKMGDKISDEVSSVLKMLENRVIEYISSFKTSLL